MVTANSDEIATNQLYFNFKSASIGCKKEQNKIFLLETFVKHLPLLGATLKGRSGLHLCNGAVFGIDDRRDAFCSGSDVERNAPSLCGDQRRGPG